MTAAELLSNTAVTIVVAAGTYNETVMLNVPSTDSLTIQGAASSTTILNGGATGSDVTIDAGTVTIDGLTISGGHSATGGGVFNNATVTLANDSIAGDSVTPGGEGGGVFNNGTASLNNDTVSGDSAASGGEGGGVFNNGTASLNNDTVSGDSATPGGLGGGVFNNGTVTLTSDTISGDSASSGGGVYNNGTAAIANSLMTINTPGGSCFGTITDGSFNVVDDSTCGFGSTSISNSSTIGLLSLAANGSTGPQTEAITSSSSAFNEVPISACTLNTDERGLPRPGVGPKCDAGAFELQPPPPLGPTPGYDLAGADGGVFVFPTGQSSGFFGSLPGLGVKVNNVVGIVPTNNFSGYNLVGSDAGPRQSRGADLLTW